MLLADQDRSPLGPRRTIDEGVGSSARALRRRRDRPDPYVVQAAIAAVPRARPTYAETDWDAVVSWYDVLLTIDAAPSSG